MTDALLIFVYEYWQVVAGFVAIAVAGLTGPFIGVGSDDPHTYDERLAQREADIALAEADEDVRLRRRVEDARDVV